MGQGSYVRDIHMADPHLRSDNCPNITVVSSYLLNRL
jgi:hypothetical protein